MPKKEKGSKSKDDSERLLRDLFEHLRQYSDYADLELWPPTKWPRKFRLRVGTTPIGWATIDWEAVLKKLIATGITLHKPSGVTDEEYVDRLKPVVATLTTGERQEIISPHLLIAFHMLIYTPEKLNQAMLDMCGEGVIHSSVNYVVEHKVKAIPTPTDFAEDIGKKEAKAIKGRLRVHQGGARENRKGLANELNLPLIVGFIDAARPFWKYVSEFFAEHHYDMDCIAWVKGKEEYMKRSDGLEGIPDDLLRQVYRKKIESGEKLQPLGLAIEHARKHFGITWTHATVRKQYKLAKTAKK